MNTIITPADIRGFRPLAHNIQDAERIQPYIAEAERIDLIHAIGAKAYEQLLSTIEQGNLSEEIELLLNGGFFSDCGRRKYQSGLIATISYLTYSRCVMQNGVNVTAFGVVVKKTETSEPVDERALVRAANNARNIGLEYMVQVVDYMKSIGLIECKNRKRVTKFKAIGK